MNTEEKQKYVAALETLGISHDVAQATLEDLESSGDAPVLHAYKEGCVILSRRRPDGTLVPPPAPEPKPHPFADDPRIKDGPRFDERSVFVRRETITARFSLRNLVQMMLAREIPVGHDVTGLFHNAAGGEEFDWRPDDYVTLTWTRERIARPEELAVPVKHAPVKVELSHDGMRVEGATPELVAALESKARGKDPLEEMHAKIQSLREKRAAEQEA